MATRNLKLVLEGDKFLATAKRLSKAVTQIGKDAEKTARKLNKGAPGASAIKSQTEDLTKSISLQEQAILELSNALVANNDKRRKGVKIFQLEGQEQLKNMKIQLKKLEIIKKELEENDKLHRADRRRIQTLQKLTTATKKQNLAAAVIRKNNTKKKGVLLDNQAKKQEEDLTQFIKNHVQRRKIARLLAQQKIRQAIAKTAELQKQHARAATRFAQQQAKAANQPTGLALSLKNVGRIIAVSLGFRAFSGLIAGLKAGTQQSLELSKGISEIQTISQSGAIGFDAWSRGLQKVSESAGLTVLDQAEAAYQALSNQVVSAADVFLFLGEANRFALGAVTDTTTAVNILSSTMNSYGLSVNTAAEISAKYFKVIELGRLRAKDIEQTFGKLEVIGNTLGVTFEEIGAAMATLTNQGINARQASTQLRGIFNKLIKPTGDMKDLFEELGVATGQEAVGLLRFGGVLEKIAEKAKGGSEELSKLINRQRGLTGAFVLTGRALAIYLDNLEQIENASGSFSRALEIIETSAFQQIRKAGVELQNFFLNIGVTLTKATADVISTVKEWGFTLTGFASGAIATMVAGLGIYIAATWEARKATLQLTAAMLRSPLVLWAAGAVLLGVVVGKLVSYFDQASQAANEMADNSRRAFANTLNAAKDTTVALAKEIKNTENLLLALTSVTRSTAAATAKTLEDMYKGTARKVEKALQEVGKAFLRQQEKIRKDADKTLARFADTLNSRLDLSAQLLAIRLAELRSKNQETNEQKITKLKLRQQQLARNAEEKGKALDRAQHTELANQIKRIEEEKVINAKVTKSIQEQLKDSQARLDKDLAGASDAERLILLEKNKAREESLRLQLQEVALAEGNFKLATKLANEAHEIALTQQREIFELTDKLNEEAHKKELERLQFQAEFKARLDESTAAIVTGGKDIKNEKDTDKRVEIIKEQIDSIKRFVEISGENGIKIDDTKFSARLEKLALLLAQSQKVQAQTQQLEPLKEAINELKASSSALAAAIARDGKLVQAQQGTLETLPDNLRKLLIDGRRLAEDNPLRVAYLAAVREDGGGSPSAKQNLAREAFQAATKELRSTPLTARELPSLAKDLQDRGAAPESQTALVEQLAAFSSAIRTEEEVRLKAKELLDVQNRLAESNNALARGINALGAGAGNAGDAFQTTAQVMTKVAARMRELLISIGGAPTDEPTDTRRRRDARGRTIYNTGGSVEYYAGGGGPKGTDTVPAWLTPGEFVVRKSMANKHRSLLSRINAGYFDQGGVVGQITPSSTSYYNSGGSVGDNNSVGDINVTLNGSGASNIIDAQAIGNALKKEIRRGRLTF